MGRRTLWPLALPLTGASTLLAHEGAYGLAGPGDDHLHGYLGHAPLLFGAFACALALAFLLRLRGRLGGAPAAWPYGAVPIAVYAVQESLERVLAGVPLSADGRALLLGLALQLPLGLVAYLLARTLLTCADTVGELVRGPIAFVISAAPLIVATPDGIAELRPALPSRGRAPPAR
jgi:hypothetical protein